MEQKASEGSKDAGPLEAAAGARLKRHLGTFANAMPRLMTEPQKMMIPNALSHSTPPKIVTCDRLALVGRGSFGPDDFQRTRGGRPPILQGKKWHI